MKRERLLILGILLIASAIVSAQEKQVIDPLQYFDDHKRWYNGFTETWFRFSDIPEAEIRKSIEHWELIGSDLASTGDSASGTYTSGGETHGSYVRWSDRSGFVWLDVDKCLGGPTRIIIGRVEPTSDGVVFVPERSFGTQGAHSNHKSHPAARINLVSVIWQGTTYLVPRDEISDFSDYSAGLGSYNGHYLYMFGNPFLVKMGPENHSLPEGRSPVYPSRYEKFHKDPVRGSVILIGKGTRRINKDSDTHDDLVTTIQVKLEGLSNVKRGLKLHVVGEEPGFTDKFELRSSKGNIATVDFVRWIPKKNCVVSANEDCAALEHLTLRLGMILSSNGM